jgi:hypothetical protein
MPNPIIVSVTMGAPVGCFFIGETIMPNSPGSSPSTRSTILIVLLPRKEPMTQPPDPGHLFGDSVRLSWWSGDGQDMRKRDARRAASACRWSADI